MKNVGLGRIGYLKEPIKIKDVVSIVKSYLNMKVFRLALGNGKSLGKYNLYIKLKFNFLKKRSMIKNEINLYNLR